MDETGQLTHVKAAGFLPLPLETFFMHSSYSKHTLTERKQDKMFGLDCMSAKTDMKEELEM